MGALITGGVYSCGAILMDALFTGGVNSCGAILMDALFTGDCQLMRCYSHHGCVDHGRCVLLRCYSYGCVVHWRLSTLAVLFSSWVR